MYLGAASDWGLLEGGCGHKYSYRGPAVIVGHVEGEQNSVTIEYSILIWL